MPDLYRWFMTPVPTHGDQQRHRIETESVNVLAGMPVMQEPDSRRQLMRLLRQRLDHQVAVMDIPEPRHQCVEIVHACLTVPAAWGMVVEVVKSLTPRAPELARLQELEREWASLHEQELRRHEHEVRDVLPEEDWSELRLALEAVRPTNLGRLYQRATGHRRSTPPVWCVNAWDMFVYLAGQNAPPHGLPREMAFLLLLEQEVDSTTAAMIRRRNQRQATAHGLTEELDRRRAAMNTGNDLPSDPFVYLVVQVEPDLEPGSAPHHSDAPASYTVSHYRQWYGEESWHSQLRGHLRGVPQADLEMMVGQLVAQMEVEWRDRRAEVVVELVLPLALLNEDVAWWGTEPAAAYLEERVLTMSYPVVVRSLDRLREPRWHRAWHRRWELLWAEPAHSRLYRSRPDGPDYFTQLEAELSADPRWGSLVLSEPPTSDTVTGRREVMTGLRAGLPVIIWHRTERTSDAFWEEIREMVASGGIARLPVHVRNSRLAALRTRPDHRASHVGRHLMVLWDDPERKPELDRPNGQIGEATHG